MLSLTQEWDGAAGEVVVTARQLQDAAWPTFRLPLEVEVRPVEGPPERHHVEITEREQTFRLRSPGPARGVTLDPDGWVLMKALAR